MDPELAARIKRLETTCSTSRKSIVLSFIDLEAEISSFESEMGKGSCIIGFISHYLKTSIVETFIGCLCTNQVLLQKKPQLVNFLALQES